MDCLQKTASSFWMLFALCIGYVSAIIFFGPSVQQLSQISYAVFAIEVCCFVQLNYAWYLQWNRLHKPILFVFTALFFLRFIYFLSDSAGLPWYLRSQSSLNAPLLSLFYIIGIVGLHPLVFLRIQSIAKWSKDSGWFKPIAVFIFWFTVLALCFYFFRSNHVSRDGMDWIERTKEPVWHLYLREPLTIALYRWVYLAGNTITVLSSKTAIALVSIVTSLIGLMFYHVFLRSAFHNHFERGLGWILLLSFGGLVSLFFGHIEVYAVAVGFLFVLTACMQKYIAGEWSVIPVTIACSLAFVAHLSAGWLLPAVFLLPFVKGNGKLWRDICILWGGFFLIQLLFWYGLIIWKYEGSLIQFGNRLHQTFHVGLDRAMFIPPMEWFTARHLSDWFSALLYLMPGGLILLPLAFTRMAAKRILEHCLWLGMLGGYLLYSFCWNPDRGYPEDWDLFSPLPAVCIPFLLKTVLGSSIWERRELNPLPVSLYIIAVGFLPFSLAQIWFHHTQYFISPTMFLRF